MNELAELRVVGETRVGWCEVTQPNETTDAFGNINPTERGFGVADPHAPSVRSYDHPEIADLREHLRAHNGLRGLDICKPTELNRAADIFFRDGFVVVDDILNEDQLAIYREGCERMLREILSRPGGGGRKYTTETGRLPHRYSYGTASSSRQLLHDPCWVQFIDLPTTTPLLERLFGSPNYAITGAGGDLCLPGAIEYQHLHGDIQERYELPPARVEQARRLGLKRKTTTNGDLEFASKRLVTDYTPPLITINFLMSDLTWENGPIRQIPGTHIAINAPPSPKDEPEWMRLCTLVGAKAGAAMFRDNRGWHGATPNLSGEIRALPDVEYLAPWIAETYGEQRFAKTMPHEIFKSLSPHAQHISRFVKAEPGVWPAGAGKMHPLAHDRKMSKNRDLEKSQRATGQ